MDLPFKSPGGGDVGLSHPAEDSSNARKRLSFFQSHLENSIHPSSSRKTKQKTKKVLIVGAGWAGTTLAKDIFKDPKGQFQIIGFVDDDPHKRIVLAQQEKVTSTRHASRVLGHCRQLIQIAKRHQPDMIILAITHKKSDHVLSELNKCTALGFHVSSLENFYEIAFKKIAIQHLEKTPFLLSFSNSKRNLLSSFFFDYVITSLLLVLSLPLFLLISIAIKLNSPGPVFYRQTRYGRNGRLFPLLKFRTMINGADRCGPHWTLKGDQRITAVGHFLRKFRLDEFPQLINILKGDMSLIGPRPEAHSLVEKFEENIPFYHCRHFIKPGVTGWAQVNYDNTCSIEGALQKLEYDLFYLKQKSMKLDLSIFLKTIRVILFPSKNEA